MDSPLKKNTSSNKIVCDECWKVLSGVVEAMSHAREHSIVTQFICGNCYKPYESHALAENCKCKVYPVKQIWQCRLCKTGFSNFEDTKNHWGCK